AKRQQGDTALIVFAGDAFTVTPLTDDVATIEAMLESLSTRTMPRQGSLVAPALIRAARLFDDAGATDGRVLLIADGVADRALAVAAAQELVERGVEVSVLGIGTPEGDVVRNSAGELIKDDRGQIVVARMDVAALSSVSVAGGGGFTMLTADDSDLAGLVGDIESSLVDGVLSEDFETDVFREVGPAIVLLCLPVIALMFRRGAVIALAALAWMPMPEAHAGVWQDLWSNDNQQAARRFEQEDFSGAAEQFRDPAWAAAASFRAGDYARSAELLEGIEHPEALYNRGNALAFAGQIDEAKQSYEQALALNPEHEDARHNLDVLNNLPPQENPQGEGSPPPEGDENQEGDQNQDGTSGQSGDQNGESGDSSDGGQSQDRSADNSPGDDGPMSDDPSDGEQAGEEGESQDEGEDGERSAEESGEPSDEEGERREASAQGSGDEEAERDLAAEQWLRQVPDDPGGLLRRKFQQQYRLRYEGRPEESQPW
ncbi:MAG: tetratricopeptide repeat protein, partial [Pseudomonadota bacterium]